VANPRKRQAVIGEKVPVQAPPGETGDQDTAVEDSELDRPVRETVGGVPRLLVLAKARSVLDAFSATEPQLSLSELSAKTGLPTSTCLRLVRNLQHEGMLERVGDRYQIGLTVVRWASSALEGRSVVDIGQPVLEWLRDQSEESTLLCVREGMYRVIVAVANSRHSIVRRLHVGEMLPLHVGSTAKIFLAFDPGAMEELRDQELEAYTPYTMTSHEALAAEVEGIRAAGWAASIQEGNEGALGVSAPVFDRQHRMAACIGLTGPMQRMAAGHPSQYVPYVLEAARRISRMLGDEEAAG
jgi:DNA-binding IclR family transcriptional regulator